MRERWRWWTPPAVAAVWVPLALTQDPVGRQWMLLVGNAAMIVVAIAGMVRHRPAGARPWWLLVAGTVSALLGGILDHVGRGTPPASGPATPPVLASAAYAFAFVCLIAGYLGLLRVRSGRRDPTRELDALIFAAAYMLLLWTFLIRPLLGTVPVGSGEWWLIIVIPALNLLMALLLYRLLLLPNDGNVTLRLIAGSMGVVVLTDGVRVALVGMGGDDTLSLGGYHIALALWAGAMLHRHVRRACSPSVADDDRPGSTRLMMLAGSAAVAPALYAMHRFAGRDDHELDGLVFLSFLLFALFVARLRVTLVALDRSRRRIAQTADREQILSRTAAALMSATDHEEVHRLCAQAAADLTGQAGARILDEPPGDGDGWVLPLVQETAPRGTCLWLSASPQPDGDVHQALAFLATATTIRLEALDAAAGLGRSEARFRSVVQHAADGIIITDADGRIRYASPSSRRLLGRPVADLLGTISLLLIDGRDEQARARAFMELVLQRPQQALTDDFKIVHVDGRPRTCTVAITNLLDEPGVRGLVMNFRDITEQEVLKATLLHRAETDELTGLGNRRRLLEHLEGLCQRQGGPFAVLLLDLDDFKTINDTLGHDAGDRLLVTIARRLEQAMRGDEVVCRLGGDEFAVVLSTLHHPDEGSEVAARLLSRLNEPTTIGVRSLRPAASVGIVLSSDVAPSTQDLLSSADLALYAAKGAGKDTWHRYTPGMREDAIARVRLEGDLERALQGIAIVNHYQPLMDLHLDRIVGAEALVRWQKPDGSIEGPAGFLSLAEETHLILELGKKVLRQACVDAVSWVAVDPAFTINVNVSGRQLDRAGFSREVIAILADTGLAPSHLVLEITETSFMRALEDCRANLESLREHGVRLAIDDFGTGYSSLGRLRTMPVDLLKIDQSFVEGVDGGPENSALAKAICRLAATLKLPIIAEGIERETQTRALKAMGCRLGQGFLYGHPMPQWELTLMQASQNEDLVGTRSGRGDTPAGREPQSGGVDGPEDG
ncbi:MAG TPA: EAL domain-containing protein [Euzebya sp.]|nr:EAL domain-containing protein [Euzebya sp.]